MQTTQRQDIAQYRQKNYFGIVDFKNEDLEVAKLTKKSYVHDQNV